MTCVVFHIKYFRGSIMRREFYSRLFTLILLPLVACQWPGEQATQPTKPPSAAPNVQFTSTPPVLTSVVGNSLEFETVVLDGCGLEKDEVELLFLTSSADIASIQNQVSPVTLQQLQNVNFDEDVVIVLLRGLKPSNNYQTVIDRIVQQNHQLIIYAQFWEPNPQWESTTAETSPCHLVKVARQLIADLSQVELTLQAIPMTPTPPAK
jgi:PrcB C-terminal